ncbi:16907_t:CDS:2 [Dentiscutata erythropus]|uniref:16907_t:CDS:1 n=1 Tax=Dentiscutata erythropus TaxID=1348616 RepID=A0A9N9BA46_9GLOM|nr:16907_t:CDS:2 [Dentiscutata erythropus]
MSHLIGEKIAKFKLLYKDNEPVVDDLQSVLVDFLPELQQKLNLDFVQVERIRQYINDRGTLFRFLRKANFNFDVASKALMSNLRWRAENHVDTISLQDVPRDFVERGLFFFHKTDKFNRPCAILNLREYVREDGSPSLNEVKKYIIFNAEVARRMLLDKSKESRDGPVLQYVILLDLKGAGVSALSLDLLRFTTDVFRHHFPGSTGARMWKLFKPILPEDALNRIFFLSENKELLDYFDEENVLIEHGGSDTYEYDLDTYKTYQYYGNPPPLLSRIPSYDSLNDEFFSAPTTPYHSRPPTPKPSPGLDHVPAWLRMTQLNMSPSAPNEFRSNIISPSPIRPTLRSPTHSSYFCFTPINQDFYLQKLLKRLVARKVSGVLYYLVIVVILRGGLVDDFWRFLTQQVTMQLGWSASTTTALTTAALSTALSGRTNNRLLLGVY